MMQLLREINHENVIKLVNVHINHVDMSLYLAFDYAEHDLYVSTPYISSSQMIFLGSLFEALLHRGFGWLSTCSAGLSLDIFTYVCSVLMISVHHLLYTLALDFGYSVIL